MTNKPRGPPSRQFGGPPSRLPMSTESHPSPAAASPTVLPDTVLSYHRRGWCVTDSPHRTKHPGRSGWQNERLTAEALRERFGSAPRNVSLLTGEPSAGVVDLDLDCVPANIAADHFMPATGATFGRPGRRRSHRLYRLSADEPLTREAFTDPVLKTPAGKPTMLLELRGTGHQTIIPPSVHQDTGDPITWDDAGDPACVALVPLRRAARITAACSLLALRWPRLNGSRHDGALALAGVLLRGGMSRNDAETFVVALADAAGCPDRAAEWVRGIEATAAALAEGRSTTAGTRLVEMLGEHGARVVARLSRWLELHHDGEYGGGAEPSSEPADQSPPVDLWGDIFPSAPPFPLDVLPPWVRAVVDDVAARIGCDPALPATAALAVAAAALDDRHQLQVRPDDPTFRVSARLWICASARPGDGKSPAQEALLAPLRDIDTGWAAEDYLARHRAEAKRARYEREYKAWVRRDDDTPPPDLPEPAPNRCRLVDDATTEALALVLADNPGGVLLYADELAALFGSMDCYRPKGIHRDRALYLSLFDGRPRTVQRATKARVVVPNYGASILGGIQPERLAQLAPTLTEDGLFARFLVFSAQPAGEPASRAPDRAALARWREAVAVLAALPTEPALLVTVAPDAGCHREHVGTLSRAFQALPELPPAFHGALAKLETQFARLALTLHVLAQPHSPPAMLIEPTAEAAARLLFDFFVPHAGRLYQLTRSTALADARWIAEWALARGHQRVSARDILRACRPLRGEPRRFDAATELLVQNGWIAPVDLYRRDAAAWTVNPHAHRAYAERAVAERRRRAAERERICAARAQLAIRAEDDT